MATLPLAYYAGLRLAGTDPVRRQWVGWGSVAVIATSPFAVRYSTEARMYMLEVVLVLVGYLALRRAMERPSAGRLALVAVVTAGLLYSQYWTVYLLAAVGAMLLWVAVRHRGPEGAAAMRCLGALVVGGLAFVPWLPTFLYQARHTGTPWSLPYTPPTAAFYALAGSPVSRRPRGTPRSCPSCCWSCSRCSPGRSTGTAWRSTCGRAPRPGPRAGCWPRPWRSGSWPRSSPRSAFQSRYAAIVFPLFVVLVAYGVVSFGRRSVRYGALALIVALGLLGGLRNVTTQRTMAGDVAAAMRGGGLAPGDVVAYCPDQLGPATSRLLPAGLAQYTFPTRRGPRFVDWVDYAERNQGSAADPEAFARFVDARAGEHTVWLVWSGGYRTYGTKCEEINGALGAPAGRGDARLPQRGDLRADGPDRLPAAVTGTAPVRARSAEEAPEGGRPGRRGPA